MFKVSITDRTVNHGANIEGAICSDLPKPSRGLVHQRPWAIINQSTNQVYWSKKALARRNHLLQYNAWCRVKQCQGRWSTIWRPAERTAKAAFRLTKSKRG